MKQIIPFEKEINLKSKAYEITSISLDDDMQLKGVDTIVGNFYIKGKYKENPSSIEDISFNYKIPVEIAISDDYDAFYAKAMVDDFYYEVEDNKLIIKIKVAIDNLNKKEEEVKEEVKQEVQEEKRCIDDEDESYDIKAFDNSGNDNNSKPILKDDFDISSDTNKDVKIQYNSDDNISLINTLQSFTTNKEDDYKTYLVYLTRDTDTFKSICDKFKTTKESIMDYNDIEDITPNMKIIIPDIQNE